MAEFLADGEVSHDTLLLVIVSLFGLAIGSPIMVMLIQSRQAGRDREDNKIHRTRIAEELKRSNERVASKSDETARGMDRSLAVIHTLVNSNLTKVMEGERAAVEQALGAITEAINMKLAMRQDVLPESYATQAQLDQQLEALNEAIHERHKTLQFLQNGSANNDNGAVA